jgi:SET domain-containing protein
VTAVKPKRKYEPWGFVLKVKRGSAGLGLFAGEDIPKGACIIEYTGRMISEKEEYTIRSQYLFDVGKRTIDGSVRSNTARYINHSCAPNCEAELYRGRVFIMARRRIRAGEELSYDYGKEFFDEYIKPKGCRCPKCASKASLN